VRKSKTKRRIAARLESRTNKAPTSAVVGRFEYALLIGAILNHTRDDSEARLS
jgi:hypothetical protein